MLSTIKNYMLRYIRRIVGTEALSQKLSSIIDDMQINSVIQKNIIQILLQQNCTDKDIYLESFSRDYYAKLFIMDNDNIKFASLKGGGNYKKIFLVTLPKSGTHFFEKILINCGYDNLSISTQGDSVNCFKDVPVEKNMSTPPTVVYLPFPIQVKILQDNQFLFGHLPFKFSPYLVDQRILITIRDLRTSLISFLRDSQRRSIYSNEPWYTMGLTEKALWTFMNTDKPLWYMQQRVADICQWVETYPESVLRFEDVAYTHASGTTKTVKCISRQTSVPPDIVSTAIDNARGVKTRTWSGNYSTLEGIWSKRIEMIFATLGGCEYNARLGYPKEWHS